MDNERGEALLKLFNCKLEIVNWKFKVLRALVINRDAPVIFCNPIRIWKLDIVVQYPVAGFVIDLARRIFNLVEYDIFIIAGYHSVWELNPVRILRVEPAGIVIFIFDYVIEPFGLHGADSG